MKVKYRKTFFEIDPSHWTTHEDVEFYFHIWIKVRALRSPNTSRSFCLLLFLKLDINIRIDWKRKDERYVYQQDYTKYLVTFEFNGRLFILKLPKLGREKRKSGACESWWNLTTATPWKNVSPLPDWLDQRRNCARMRFELGALTVLKDNNDDKKGTEWREPPPRAYNLVILISGIHRAVCKFWSSGGSTTRTGGEN